MAAVLGDIAHHGDNSAAKVGEVADAAAVARLGSPRETSICRGCGWGRARDGCRRVLVVVTRKTLPATHPCLPVSSEAREAGVHSTCSARQGVASALVAARRAVRPALRPAAPPRGWRAAERCRAGRAGSFGRFHFQRVVEAVEVVEQADDGGQFDDFALVEVLAQPGPEFVVDVGWSRGSRARPVPGRLFRAD